MGLMAIIYSAIISLLIVCGQALWKSAVVELTERHIQLFSTNGFVQLILAPKLIFGAFVYGIATIAYIYLLSKYDYFQTQSIVVGCSLVLTLAVATSFFGERPSIVNIAGVVLIVLGSVLVISR